MSFPQINGVRNKLVDVSKGWDEVISSACRCLRQHGVVAVPTDTIYGIAVQAQSTEAIGKLYKIKGREQGKPISICVADIKDIPRWAKVNIPESLLSKLLPGPVTVVFERTLNLNHSLNPGTTLVGVRVPDHGFMRELCRAYEEPLALTSANRSSQPSALKVQEFHELWPHLDLICDEGTKSCHQHSRAGSTVVDLSKQGFFTIIRQGSAYQQTSSLLKSHGLEEEIKGAS